MAQTVMTEEKKLEYAYYILEALGILCGDTICAAKMWAELVIQEQKTWGQVPSTKKLTTAERLIELGYGDLVPDDYKQANGLE